MSPKINPRNLTAQLHHRARGNPENTLPHTAISNCFPGLETDFRNFWRRAFIGIVLLECNNYVVDVEDDQYKGLRGHRLLQVDGRPLVTTVVGPRGPDFGPSNLTSATNPAAVAFMEWSNALAFVLQRQGKTVTCHFTLEPSDKEQPVATDPAQMLAVSLTVRRFFKPESATPAAGLLQPGELTQGLCSPWQNDYRECACYYWAASRPDYANVEPTPEGVSRGDNWLSKERSGEYILDDRADQRLVSYDDLFQGWEKVLRFQLKGRDADQA
jgi:hypothetical protein